MISLLLVVLVATAFGQGATNDESQVWNLEKAYWEYVKANDLDKYRALWARKFSWLAIRQFSAGTKRSHY